MDSMETLDYTFAYSKYSCIKQFYWFHIISGYFVALCGLGCLISRAIPRFKHLHIYFGKGYILFMLLCTAFSLLMNNTGIPTGVLLSFCWVLGGLAIGWILIQFHQYNMNKQALARVETAIACGEFKNDLARAIGMEKNKISEERTLSQRIFSLKTLHGLVFFTSWLNILGQVATGNIRADYECYTYPVYKNISSVRFTPPPGDSLTLVPEKDPKYDRLPWGNKEAMWGVQLSLGPMFFGLLFGTAFAYWSIRKQRQQ